jgi:hypothetical protein
LVQKWTFGVLRNVREELFELIEIGKNQLVSCSAIRGNNCCIVLKTSKEIFLLERLKFDSI